MGTPLSALVLTALKVNNSKVTINVVDPLLWGGRGNGGWVGGSSCSCACPGNETC
jgi:hypothetical protein